MLLCESLSMLLCACISPPESSSNGADSASVVTRSRQTLPRRRRLDNGTILEPTLREPTFSRELKSTRPGALLQHPRAHRPTVIRSQGSVCSLRAPFLPARPRPSALSTVPPSSHHISRPWEMRQVQSSGWEPGGEKRVCPYPALMGMSLEATSVAA
ncbi:hypothetical protein NDU88_004974 [Pleurodeles waltl]|uniref:Secreted protein n=1 Tax=Pleurodeles waltl TaxID=8319 RepID=A0AAV7VM88_PLEWA|nr:hypothetical protein NDU88_004974 [Pleurodeles waltl]